MRRQPGHRVCQGGQVQVQARPIMAPRHCDVRQSNGAIMLGAPGPGQPRPAGRQAGHRPAACAQRAGPTGTEPALLDLI
jgi:hypothetical protein